jgi:hypothetical protein
MCIRTMDTAVKSDSVEQFRSNVGQEEIDVKLDRVLQSRIYTPLLCTTILRETPNRKFLGGYAKIIRIFVVRMSQ